MYKQGWHLQRLKSLCGNELARHGICVSVGAAVYSVLNTGAMWETPCRSWFLMWPDACLSRLSVTEEFGI
ncbi:Alginate biosynthesis AlgK [Gossypium arboreum]|uniref:Alginate biosynthesis AlgK n=1 Tax=Gossypium arboreum TaxID=29729 RepID=A0A0B0PET2_GOSAR|nr:Alginate biosynthesis AlgK [Gossypium arboreum]